MTADAPSLANPGGISDPGLIKYVWLAYIYLRMPAVAAIPLGLPFRR